MAGVVEGVGGEPGPRLQLVAAAGEAAGAPAQLQPGLGVAGGGRGGGEAAPGRAVPAQQLHLGHVVAVTQAARHDDRCRHVTRDTLVTWAHLSP